MHHPLAVHAKMMGDIIHMHQAICQPDALQLINAMIRDFNAYIEKKHWVLIKECKVAKDADIIPAIWSMCGKCNLTTNVITKYKARFSIYGGKQVYGMNYYKTYTPVVTRYAICLIITFSILFRLSLCQVDFVLAYTQAPVEIDLYMELPQGINTK